MKSLPFPTRLLLPLVISYFLFSSLAFPQGSLTPPGPPAPTMKRLDEVEPRTNLQATPAPAGVDTTNANYHFIINQPGSYYLSGDVAVTKANGIQINAEGVTLDLNGFQISRVSGSGGDGIQISVNCSSYETAERLRQRLRRWHQRHRCHVRRPRKQTSRS